MKKSILTGVKWGVGVLLLLALAISGALYFFKDEICGYVVQELNKNLKAKVSVEAVDLTFWATFPNVSVDFNKVFIRDSQRFAGKSDTLFYSERVRLKFNARDVWNERYNVKTIEVFPGELHLKVDKKGGVNYEIMQASNDSTPSSFAFDLQKVTVKQLDFSYANAATNQRYAAFVNDVALKGNFTEKQYVLQAKSALRIKQLRSGKVTLIANRPAQFDIAIAVNQVENQFAINNALIYVSNLPFHLKANVNPTDFKLELHSKDIQLADVANNFSLHALEEKLERFQGSGKVYFDAYVNGKRERTSNTAIECDFGVDNGSLFEPTQNVRIKQVHLKGKYSNIGGASREFLKLSTIRFTTSSGGFEGKLLLTHFHAPTYQGSATGTLNLAALHSVFHLPYIETVTGNLGIHADFNVQTRLDTGKKTYAINACEGEITFRDVAVKLIDDKLTFSQLNGLMYLRNEEIGIDEVRLMIGATDLTLNGVFKNYLPYLEKTGTLLADIELKSRLINVQELGTTSKQEKIQEERFYVIPDDIEAKVLLDVGTLNYEQHTFKQLRGNMTLSHRKMYFPALTLLNADANIHGSLAIEEQQPEYFYITTQVATESLQFKALFKEWDNFHQEVISENNIFGKAQANVFFEAPFDLRTGIVSKSIKSIVYLKINDGRLKGVDAFKSIAENLKSPKTRLLLGNERVAELERKLLDLSFDTLENTFTIRNGQLEIPAMHIASSLLNVDVSGTHGFDNAIDYHFAFNFRELKAKTSSTEFGEEVDDGTGLRLFMRMYGTIDHPIIVWDKASSKEQARIHREAEKQTVKSILKTEFGLFKKDTTVKAFQPKENPKEELKIEFNPTNTPSPSEPEPIKKDSKLKEKLKKWKEQKEKEEKEEIGFD